MSRISHSPSKDSNPSRKLHDSQSRCAMWNIHQKEQRDPGQGGEALGRWDHLGLTCKLIIRRRQVVRVILKVLAPPVLHSYFGSLGGRPGWPWPRPGEEVGAPWCCCWWRVRLCLRCHVQTRVGVESPVLSFPWGEFYRDNRSWQWVAMWIAVVDEDVGSCGRRRALLCLALRCLALEWQIFPCCGMRMRMMQFAAASLKYWG